MANIERLPQSDFDKEVGEYVNDLYLAYDEESEKRVRADILEMYKERIPTVSYILDNIESYNYDTCHGIAYTLLKFKQGDVYCDGDESLKKEFHTIGFHVCENCSEKEDCYDNVLCNNVHREFEENALSPHLCNLLYSVLTDGDLCVYMTKRDFYEYLDLAGSYDYGNYDILDNFYSSGNNKMTIINHAQKIMFDDLFENNEDGSCYNYGNFLFMTDPFERKNREEYLLGGGN